MRVLLAGLGNLSHPGTRHSAGHMLVDALALSLQAPLPLAAAADGFLSPPLRIAPGATLWLFKPRPLMNVSGRALKKCARMLGVDPRCVIVAHDEVGKRVGRFSWRRGGSSCGHNGVKSAAASLGTPDFIRLRLGISRAPSTSASHKTTADYVLARFPPDELRALRASFPEIERELALLCRVRGDLSRFGKTKSGRTKVDLSGFEDEDGGDAQSRGGVAAGGNAEARSSETASSPARDRE